ncbi:MAG: DEAD/DEAH box helicase, partial [Thiohalocapsa sp.]
MSTAAGPVGTPLARSMPSDNDLQQYLRVAIAAPLRGLFDYLPPVVAFGQQIFPGMRVLVPFGRGRRIGIITAVATTTESPAERLRSAEAVLDRTPLLTDQDLRFVLWAADYYHASPGEALFTALPARLRRAQPGLETLVGEPHDGWRVKEARVLDNGTREQIHRRAPRQAEALALLDTHREGLDDASIRGRIGNCSAVLRALADKDLIERCRIDSAAGRVTPGQSAPPPELNPDQRAAVQSIRETRGFHCFLLDGVTGSGKTEVYLRLIDDALRRGRQALVLVPEIGLTPQLRDRFLQRIDVPMAVLHSALGERERELAWNQAVRGQARLVLGTRSAVFTPLPALDLIIVDEEHDLSLKQQDGFRYSARDLAVRRAQIADCPVVLGSATPSLETLY